MGKKHCHLTTVSRYTQFVTQPTTVIFTSSIHRCIGYVLSVVSRLYWITGFVTYIWISLVLSYLTCSYVIFTIAVTMYFCCLFKLLKRIRPLIKSCIGKVGMFHLFLCVYELVWELSRGQEVFIIFRYVFPISRV